MSEHPKTHSETRRDNESPRVAKKPTPLPKFQLFILLIIQFAEPVTGEQEKKLAIYPYRASAHQPW
jgi:hypothetical protein